MVVDDDRATDWDAVNEAIPESYCLLAPKKLVAQLDEMRREPPSPRPLRRRGPSDTAEPASPSVLDRRFRNRFIVALRVVVGRREVVLHPDVLAFARGALDTGDTLC